MKKLAKLALPASVLVVLLAVARAAPDEQPFSGWDAGRVEVHRRSSTNAIRAKLRTWLDARKALIQECGKCSGRGEVEINRRTHQRASCRTCGGRGTVIDPSAFFTVYWDLYAPAARELEPIREILDAYLRYAREKRPTEVGQLTRWRIGAIQVFGDHARAKYTRMDGRLKSEHELRWVLVGDAWWIHAPGRHPHPVASHDYPIADEEGAAGKIDPATEIAPPPRLPVIEARPEVLAALFSVGSAKKIGEKPSLVVDGKGLGKEYIYEASIRNADSARTFSFLNVRFGGVAGAAPRFDTLASKVVGSDGLAPGAEARVEFAVSDFLIEGLQILGCPKPYAQVSCCIRFP